MFVTTGDDNNAQIALLFSNMDEQLDKWVKRYVSADQDKPTKAPANAVNLKKFSGLPLNAEKESEAANMAVGTGSGCCTNKKVAEDSMLGASELFLRVSLLEEQLVLAKEENSHLRNELKHVMYKFSDLLASYNTLRKKWAMLQAQDVSSSQDNIGRCKETEVGVINSTEASNCVPHATPKKDLTTPLVPCVGGTTVNFSPGCDAPDGAGFPHKASEGELGLIVEQLTQKILISLHDQRVDSFATKAKGE